MRARRGVVATFVLLVLLACSQGNDRHSGDDRSAAPPAEAASADSTETPQLAPARKPDEAQVRADREAPARSGTASRPAPSLTDVLAQHADSLRAVQGVLDVDSVACNGDPCIQVTVMRRTQSILSELPGEIDGYAVVVVERRRQH